jgi:hypothetical protein
MIHHHSTRVAFSHGRVRAARAASVPFAVFVSLLLPTIFVSSYHAVLAQDKPLPDFNTFTNEVKKRLKTDEALQSGYAYSERQVAQKRDGDGRVREEHVKVYEVYPPLPGEEPYRRLIEEDGRPVPKEKLEKQDRERQKKVEAYARELADRSAKDVERAKREYSKDMAEREADIEDIFNVFDISMTGREQVNGHGTIAVTLMRKPNAKARTDSGRMMQHFNARAWISESEYELVRIEVEAIDNISFGLGLLARLHKGATASFERRKVNNEAWLPAKMAYAASGRLLMLRQLRLAGSSEFFNYRRFAVETTTTIGEPLTQ